MREAMFETVFCGIETTGAGGAQGDAKEHNMMVPILEAVETLNSYGMEVVSGIILGLDTDTPDSGKHLLEFVEQLADPDADHESAAGAAAHAAVGPAQARAAPDRGRRRPANPTSCSACPTSRCWRCGASACASPIGPKRSMRATSTRSGRPIPTACNPPDSALRAPTWAQHPARADRSWCASSGTSACAANTGARSGDLPGRGCGAARSTA